MHGKHFIIFKLPRCLAVITNLEQERMLEATFKLNSYNNAIQPFCHHGTAAILLRLSWNSL